MAVDYKKMKAEYEKYHSVYYDRDGCPFDVYIYKDLCIHYVVPMMKAALIVNTVKIRPDDVLLYSYPNAGSHWTFEIANMILNEKAERIPRHKEGLLLEMTSIDDFDSAESPRLLNTHLKPDFIPPDLLKDHKIIYLTRNPKALAVSFYRHIQCFKEFKYKGNYPSFFEMFMEGKIPYGDFFKHTQVFWSLIKDNPNVFLLTYEELSQKPLETVSQLSKFLGKIISDELGKNILEMCSFDKMKNEKRFIDMDSAKSILNADHTIYHSGKVDTWKKWLTVEQSERMDAKIQSELIDQGIRLNF